MEEKKLKIIVHSLRKRVKDIWNKMGIQLITIYTVKPWKCIDESNESLYYHVR